MADRYFSIEPIQGPTVTLTGSEAHHLLHVMRARPGLQVVLFDGQGGQYEAEVAVCGRTTVELTVGDRQDVNRELPFMLTLATALPKGDRQRWLIEKAVELGVTRLAPLRTDRSASGTGDCGSKLHRYVIEASKQCGRNHLLEIVPSRAWADLLQDAGEGVPGRRLLAHPGGRLLAEFDLAAPCATCVAVGPEGGFTEDEVTQAYDSGWEVVSLGNRILRVETAALAIVSAVGLGYRVGAAQRTVGK